LLLEATSQYLTASISPLLLAVRWMEAARRANRKVFIEKYLLARFFYGRE
jgi:hypothetical protein